MTMRKTLLTTKVTITATEKDFSSTLFIATLENIDSKKPLTISVEPIAFDLQKGESKTATFTIDAPSEAGTHVLAIIDYYGVVIYNYGEIATLPLPEGELKYLCSTEEVTIFEGQKMDVIVEGVWGYANGKEAQPGNSACWRIYRKGRQQS